MTHFFTIYGKPQAKQRPRFAVRTASKNKGKNTAPSHYVQTITPAETIAYEQLVRLRYMELFSEPLVGEIKANLVFYFEPNKSESTKKFLQRVSEQNVYYTKKPDCDNLAKTILDALNTIAYHDDSQIVELCVKKMYSPIPRVEVTLETLS